MAAAANSKIFSKMKKNKLQLDIGGGSYCCSICGKKLKNNFKRKMIPFRHISTSEDWVMAVVLMAVTGN